MPTLHVQFSGQGQNQSGQQIQIHPAQALAHGGPRLQITLGVSRAIATPLLAKGVTLPTPVSGAALIDTGASTSCIDDAAAQNLGLPVIDQVNMASASHSSTAANVYPAHLTFVGFGIEVDMQRAIGASLASQGLLVLIGRDLLAHFTVFYNGPTGQITLSM